MPDYDVWFAEMKPTYTGLNKHGYGYVSGEREYLGVYYAFGKKEAEDLASECTGKEGIFEADLIFWEERK